MSHKHDLFFFTVMTLYGKMALVMLRGIVLIVSTDSGSVIYLKDGSKLEVTETIEDLSGRLISLIEELDA